MEGHLQLVCKEVVLASSGTYFVADTRLGPRWTWGMEIRGRMRV